MTASETGDAAALPDLLKSDAWSALIEIAKSLQAASMSSILPGHWSLDIDADVRLLAENPNRTRPDHGQ